MLLVGLFVAMVTMFNQVNGRLDTMNQRIDSMQVETNRRFDTLQDEMNRRFDTMQAENHRQHDEIKEVLRIFEGRLTRLEEKVGIGPEDVELGSAETGVGFPFDDILPIRRVNPARSHENSIKSASYEDYVY